MESLPAPKPSSSETLTPPESFVPPLARRPEDERGRYGLYGMMQRWGLSIESAELEFTRGGDIERSVYGAIYINNSKKYRVHPVYNRSSGEAETVPGGGGQLSLSGPKFFLDSFAPTAMYVDLREAGKASLINQRVLLPVSGISPSGSVSVEAAGEEASLTIRMTVICSSILTNISMEVCYPDSYQQWLVSGTVTAIQTINNGRERRRLRLFKRRETNPMIIGAKNARIVPDREVFVAPLWFEKSYIEKYDKLLAEAGHSSSGMAADNDTYNGVGCYLSVDVDLKFVDSVDVMKSSLVRGVLHYQFRCTHEHRAQFRATLKGPVLREKKEPKLPRLSTDIDGDEIEVALTLEPYAEIAPDLDGEPFEDEMPLYVDPEAGHNSESNSEDEQTESKDEESDKPVTVDDHK